MTESTITTAYCNLAVRVLANATSCIRCYLTSGKVSERKRDRAAESWAWLCGCCDETAINVNDILAISGMEQQEMESALYDEFIELNRDEFLKVCELSSSAFEW